MCYARLTYKPGGHGSQPLVRGFQTTVSDLCNLRVVPEGWRPQLWTQEAHRVRLLLGDDDGSELEELADQCLPRDSEAQLIIRVCSSP